MGGSGPFQDKPALRVDGLSIARGGRVLFDALSFGADLGDYVELRGANGAGKTSLLRALAGFLKPRAGAIAYANVEEPSTALHFIAHGNALKLSASVRAHLRYWSGLFGVEARDGAVLERVGLAPQANLAVRALSQGQARRLALSRLVLAPRKIWLLDEPAAALDAQGREMLAGLIDAHRKDGGIVIAALHEGLGPTPSVTLTVGA